MENLIMPDNTHNEIKLLQSSITGDATSFEIIVSKYKSLICAITYSATGDVTKSEELAQDIFVKSWKGLTTLNNLKHFRSWISTIARKIIRDHYRVKKNLMS